MTLLQAIILGAIQGITEFLPVSSSAHLVLAPFLFGWDIPKEHIFPFDVLVQLGTLLAVVIYFRNDLLNILKAMMIGITRGKPFSDPASRLGWYLVFATIPAGIFGLLLKDQVEGAFNSPVITSLFLFVTGALLILAEWIGRREKPLTALTWKDALTIGLFQVLALFPGVSRSGSTMAGGMSRHLDRPSAGRFSFLMSIPIMLAAGLFSIFDLQEVPNLEQFLPLILTGFVVAAVVGLFSINWLLRFLTRRSLIPFSIYCVLFATLNLIVWYV